MEPGGFHFLDCTLRPALRQVCRGGAPVVIGARAHDLLLHRVSNADRIVTRDEAMLAVWGEAVVGDNNLNVQAAALRRLFGRAAVVTVPGRGLRFGHPVRRVAEAAPVAPPDRPSVVVLPFADLGADGGWGWLADCVVEDATTELSRFRDLFVVARNSAYAWRGQARDVQAAARDLGVRYAVEGGLRVAGGHVRVTVQLIDATTGGHVWAETLDAPVAGALALQGRIAAAVVAALAPQIDAAETTRLRRPPPADLAAFGLARQAWAAVRLGEMAHDPAPRRQAAGLAQAALDADPECPVAWRALAKALWWEAYHGTTDDFAATVAQGAEAAARVIALDALDHHAWRLKALLAFLAQDAGAGLAALRHAHDLNPNCALTQAWLGMYEAMHGEPSRAVPLAKAALRLSPRDPARGAMLCALGFAQFTVRDYAGAAASAQAALLGMANAAPPLVLRAIAHVGAGNLAAGAAAFARLRATAPALAEARLAGRWLSTNADYRARAQTFLCVAAGLAPPAPAAALR